MAERSFLWTTNNTGDGTGTGYTQTDASNIFEITAQCFGRNGVAPNYLNSLTPSTTGANNARVATGGAMVDGKPYKNDANVDVVIPSAVGGGNTRIDRVVLRCSWSAQTVRVTRIAGVDAASPTAPAITQNSGSTYDIKICRALVDTIGTVTITDERDMAQVDTNEITDGAITGTKIADANITLSKLGINSVDASKIVDSSVGSYEIATGAVIATKIAAGAVIAGKIDTGGVSATAQLADNIVDDTKVGNRVPQFYRRQGGSTSDWSAVGTTAYTPGAVRMQAGANTITISTGISNDLSITFPVSFSGNIPLVITGLAVNSPGQVWDVGVLNVSTTGFTARATRTATSGSDLVGFNWLAIGPE